MNHLPLKPWKYDDTAKPHPERKRPPTRIVVIIVIVVLGVVGYMISPLRAVSAKADIDPALLQQGTIYYCSNNAVINDDPMNVDVMGAGGFPWNLGATLGLHSTKTRHGVSERVPLGGSLTLPGLGTVYLIELVNWHGHQDVKILYIPES